MSYGYLLIKVNRRFTSTYELTPDNAVPVGEPSDIANAISRVFADVRWDEPPRHGALDLEGRWFEFNMLEERPLMFVGVRTSFRHESRDVVERVCDALDLVAFDGQKMKLYAPASVATSGEAGWYDSV